MVKAIAAIQAFMMICIVGYGTYQLFRGDFEQAFAAVPLLMIYYIFVTARQKRAQAKAREDAEEEK